MTRICYALLIRLYTLAEALGWGLGLYYWSPGVGGGPLLLEAWGGGWASITGALGWGVGLYYWRPGGTKDRPTFATSTSVI